jgi:hypothetical protein
VTEDLLRNASPLPIAVTFGKSGAQESEGGVQAGQGGVSGLDLDEIVQGFVHVLGGVGQFEGLGQRIQRRFRLPLAQEGFRQPEVAPTDSRHPAIRRVRLLFGIFLSNSGFVSFR